jgi:hypothetical protein
LSATVGQHDDGTAGEHDEGNAGAHVGDADRGTETTAGRGQDRRFHRTRFDRLGQRAAIRQRGWSRG